MTVETYDTASATLRLSGEVTIYQAAQLKQELLAALARQALELDLAGVTELDTAGLQLLLLARDTARARNTALRLVAPSAAVMEALRLAGLAGICAAEGEAGHGI